MIGVVALAVGVAVHVGDVGLVLCQRGGELHVGVGPGVLLGPSVVLGGGGGGGRCPGVTGVLALLLGGHLLGPGSVVLALAISLALLLQLLLLLSLGELVGVAVGILLERGNHSVRCDIDKANASEELVSFRLLL